MDSYKLKKWLEELIEKDELWRFYKSREFRALRKQILKDDHYECQICKRPNATTVHHVQFVRKHPELALSKYYWYQGKKYRNLISVCKECHNALHPEKRRGKERSCNHQVTQERW